ncbi:unnamed protein product [Rhizoctonia solani]|uniref:Uncharacterized protein n=1 Tax=Rhizoctonia solani TaxID=456999 RepID=A0A8H3CL78_9AGAM|nr:unnamed protein product [Rhizoctonia solani]
MTVPQSNEIHQQWGSTITEYPKFYSNTSLSGNSEAPVDETDRAIGRDVALRTIEQICMMDHSSIEEPCNTELVNYITLEQLRCISKLARCPGELDNFALPRLVAGCVTLMVSIKPSPFHYEYGYLCFRIIVIAINTCLLKHGRDSTEPLRIPTYFPNNYLTDLWTETAILLKAELAGYSEVFFEKTDMRSGPRTAPYLEALRLDVLLALLHDNQKNFTILLKEANSLGLSGLMYVLLKFVEKNKADMSEEQYQERFLIPYTRIFYRYRLFVPDFPFELDTEVDL